MGGGFLDGAGKRSKRAESRPLFEGAKIGKW